MLKRLVGGPVSGKAEGPPYAFPSKPLRGRQKPLITFCGHTFFRLVRVGIGVLYARLVSC